MEQGVTLTPTRDGGWPAAWARFWVGNRVALVVLGALVLLAIGSRFWDLGARALHHDESLHAVYSYKLYDEGVYEHDPLMHGPVLFHLSALGFWLFGASDFTSRLVPALLGVLLVWAPWKFRRWIGVKGAVAAAALILISPSLLYYSRFIRHDIFFAAWTVMILYGMWAYLDEGEDFHLYLMVAGWALAFSQKEVSFLLAMVLWVGLLAIFAYHYRVAGKRMAFREMREWHLLIVIGALLLPLASALLLHLLGQDPASGYNATAYRDWGFIRQAGLLTAGLFVMGGTIASWLWDGRKFLIAAGVFYAIFALFHTTFLTWPFGLGSGLVGALGYWIEQHDVARGGQPWYYYIGLLVPLYEFLGVVVGVGGTLLLLRRGASEPILPAREEAPHLNARALWPLYNLWWFASILFALSYAGEKMPWLMVHIALPLAFLGGWALDRLFERIAWPRVASQAGLLFALSFTVAMLAFAHISWLALRGEWPPLGETDAVSLGLLGRWVAAVLLLAGASWLAARASDRLGGRTTRHLAALSVTTLLALATIRFAVIASFINADVPHEPMIYTQSSPDVPMVMREIRMISERIAGGTNLQVAYDSSTSWPFEWYLRDYPNKFFFGSNPDGYLDRLRDSAVVLAGPENGNVDRVKQLLPDYIRHEYSMRPNFPEDYKNINQIRENRPDPNDASRTVRVWTGETSKSPLTLLANVAYLALQPQSRVDFLDFYLHRRWKAPLGDYPMTLFVKPEVAADVWQYGATVATLDPELVRDPYAEVITELPAAVTLPGFNRPRNLTVLPDGNLAVADSGNHRIRIVTPEGELVRQFGSFGTEPGQFNEPWGIAAAPDGTLYVADTWNHRVQHLTAEGEVIATWGSYSEAGDLAGNLELWGPRDVAVDAEGNVFVSDTGNKWIKQYDAEGNFLGKFGGSGSEPGQLAEPVGVTVAPDGTIWVADTWNRRVQGLSPGFLPQAQHRVRAWDGQSIINKPYIAASEERLWLSDPEGQRLIELDLEGNPTRVWGQLGNGPTQLNQPYGLAYHDGLLWVADSENNRILAFEVP